MELPVDMIPSEEKPIDKRLAQMPYKLFKVPANIMILGRAGSGKSSILYSLLSKGFVWGKNKKSIFDEAIIYLGTQDAKFAFENLNIKNKIVLDEFEADFFEEYLNDLKEDQMDKLQRGKSALNSIVIFDDYVGHKLIKPHGGKASVLERLALTSRHEANMSLVFCSQVYRNSGFSQPSIRNNVTTYIIAQMTRPEIEKIAEEHCQDLTIQEFIHIYDDIMAKRPYNFMVIDMRRPLNERITERFTIPIKRPTRLNNITPL
jgi:GTPase SAR1 family protein